MPDLFLHEDEVEQLTGLKRPSAQARFIRTKLHTPAFVNAANKVVVYRHQVAEYFGADSQTVAMPDFDAMDHVAT